LVKTVEILYELVMKSRNYVYHWQIN